jgi:EpsI family protein
MSSHKESERDPHSEGEMKWADICLSRPLLLRLSVLLVLMLVLYYPTLQYLVDIWWKSSEYSYGFLVPWISIYLIWLRRNDLIRLERRPALRDGILMLAFSGSLLVIGRIGGLVRLEGISLVLEIAGLVILLSGWRVFRCLALPIGYLVFMVPFFDEVLVSLNWHFQLLTARMADRILGILGIPVQLHGNYLALPNIILEVAASCSGVRYLISIVAIGIPLSFTRLRKWWARLLLIISALFIAIVSNWLRVVLIGVWLYLGGKAVHGPIHVFHALVVAWIGYGALFFNTWLISKWEGRKPAAISLGPNLQNGKPSCYGPASDLKPVTLTKTWGTALGSLVMIALVLTFYDRGPVPIQGGPSSFPNAFGKWVERPLQGEEPLVRIDGADLEFLKQYTNNTGTEVFFYLAYFESQKQGKEAVSFRLRPFYLFATTFTIGAPGKPPEQVNITKVPFDARMIPVIFWYDLNGKVLSGRSQAKFYTIWDALLRGRTNGALLLIYEKAPEGSSGNNDYGYLKDFLRSLLPILKDFLPH